MALVANVTLVGLSLILGIRLLRQYAVRPRAHTLWYAIGLLLTAVAATPELYHELTNQVPTALWWLYWASASSLVGFLSVGTAYLMSPRFGRAALAAVALLTLWVAVATVMTAGAGPGPDMFHKAPTTAVKIPFLIQNIGGSLVILAGAVISYIRTRGLYALLIALGTLVFASGGSAAGNTPFAFIFAFTQTIGIILLYAGVALSLRPPKKEGGQERTDAAQS
jgi:hypothetical protein